VVSTVSSNILTSILETFSFVDDSDYNLVCQTDLLSFNEASKEAAMSRFYGGIHYRAAIENGLYKVKK
jgi:hypothetical protein